MIYLQSFYVLLSPTTPNTQYKNKNLINNILQYYIMLLISGIYLDTWLPDL